MSELAVVILFYLPSSLLLFLLSSFSLFSVSQITGNKLSSQRTPNVPDLEASHHNYFLGLARKLDPTSTLKRAPPTSFPSLSTAKIGPVICHISETVRDRK